MAINPKTIDREKVYFAPFYGSRDILGTERIDGLIFFSGKLLLDALYNTDPSGEKDIENIEYILENAEEAPKNFGANLIIGIIKEQPLTEIITYNC